MLASGKLLSVPTAWCYGATPQFVDYDNDGDLDIISGSYVYNKEKKAKAAIWIFRKDKDGYAEGKKLTDKNGSPFLGRAAMVPSFGDIDNDGDLDLIYGQWNSKINYAENIGGFKFKKAIELKLPISYDGIGGVYSDFYKTSPRIYDFDRDGHSDLVITSGGGVVYFLRRDPKIKTSLAFEKPVVLLANKITKNGKETKLFKGTFSYFALGDLDKDGNEDLLTMLTDGYLYHLKRTQTSK